MILCNATKILLRFKKKIQQDRVVIQHTNKFPVFKDYLRGKLKQIKIIEIIVQQSEFVDFLESVTWKRIYCYFGNKEYDIFI